MTKHMGKTGKENEWGTRVIVVLVVQQFQH